MPKKWLREILKKCFEAYRPLTLIEIARNLNFIDEAAKTIKNKDIILLLGKSGTGKTTLSQGLVGFKLVKKIINDKSHYEADAESIKNFFIENPELENNEEFKRQIYNYK